MNPECDNLFSDINLGKKKESPNILIVIKFNFFEISKEYIIIKAVIIQCGTF